MARMTTGKTLPSLGSVQAEAARIEALIQAATKRIDSSECNLRTHMHLQVCRAELQAYFAGLMYSLGHTNLLSPQYTSAGAALEMPSVGESFSAAGDDEELRYVQCFEC